MSELRAMTEQEKQNLSIPEVFWRVINAEFEFQLDACATEQTKKTPEYIGPDHPLRELRDAFSCYWVGEPDYLRVWCNPPFRDVIDWHKKAHEEADRHPSAVIAVLGLPGGSQEWFRFAHKNASEIRILTPRIQFDVPEGCKRFSNSRDSWLTIYRRKGTSAPAQIVPWDWKAGING